MKPAKYIVIGGVPRNGTHTVASFLHIHPSITCYSGWMGAPWEPEHWPNLPQVQLQMRPEQLTEPDPMAEEVAGWMQEASAASVIANRDDGFERWYHQINTWDDVESWRFIYMMRADPVKPFRSRVELGGMGAADNHFHSSQIWQSLEQFRRIRAPKYVFSVDDPDYHGLMEWIGLEITPRQIRFADWHPRTHSWDSRKTPYDGELELSEHPDIDDFLRGEWEMIYAERNKPL